MSYDITFDGYKNKLKGRLYGLLCEMVNGKNFLIQLLLN